MLLWTALPKEVNKLKHGHATRKRGLTPTYRSYRSMITRCYNRNREDYKLYGERGIKVCDRWLKSFQAFLEDMGERPEGRTLDRVDCNGNYEPGNCRWATIDEQVRNQRPRFDSIFITFAGQTLTFTGWSNVTGLSRAGLKDRLFVQGLSVEDALTRPSRSHRRLKSSIPTPAPSAGP